MNALNPTLALTLLLMVSQAAAADAAEPLLIGPWRLNMTPQEVQSFSEFGPYEVVRATGGLETANGQFLGARTNVSFVFDARGVEFIQVWKYEGKEEAAAQAAVLDIFRLFADKYGGARVDNVEFDGPAGLNEEAMKALLGRVIGTARAMSAEIRQKHKVGVTVMFDMMPNKQPADTRLHSTWGYSGKFDTFYVFLFQDRVDAEPRRVKANVQVDDP
jgi:hypothetical protein